MHPSAFWSRLAVVLKQFWFNWSLLQQDVMALKYCSQLLVLGASDELLMMITLFMFSYAENLFKFLQTSLWDRRNGSRNNCFNSTCAACFLLRSLLLCELCPLKSQSQAVIVRKAFLKTWSISLVLTNRIIRAVNSVFHWAFSQLVVINQWCKGRLHFRYLTAIVTDYFAD